MSITLDWCNYHPSLGPQARPWWKLLTVKIHRCTRDPYWYFWITPISYNAWIYSRWGALCINTGGWQEWQGSNLRPPVLEFAGCRPKQSSRMPIWLICSALVSAFDCLIPPRRCRKPWPTTPTRLIYIEREEIEGWPRKTRIVRHRPSKARRAAATARSKIEVLLEMT